jgi:hypothetical protein
MLVAGEVLGVRPPRRRFRRELLDMPGDGFGILVMQHVSHAGEGPEARIAENGTETFVGRVRTELRATVRMLPHQQEYRNLHSPPAGFHLFA